MENPTDNLNGKICMITGASSGIGKATALGLAKMGMRVIAVCRDPKRGQDAVNEIVAKSGNESAVLMLADLSSQRAIRQLARDFKDRYSRLDVLVNNAATFTRKRTLTEDDIETQFAVNHLAYFLLTNLLLDVLRAGAPARILNVASSAERFGRIDFDDLQGQKRYSGYKAYNQSKLANILFTYELARRLKETGVTSNCLHPGLVMTNLGLNYTSRVFRFIRIFSESPEKGAETPIYLASSPKVEGVSGKYFIRKTAVKSSRKSYNESLAKRLWHVSEELTRLNPLD